MDLLDGAAIMARIDTLAAITAEAGAMTRLTFTPEHRRANALVSGWMAKAGMTVHMDGAGNVLGRYEGKTRRAPAVMLGSHLDTGRRGSRFAGALGVVCGLACVAELNERGERLPHAIEIAGFSSGLGLRFDSPMLGSRALAGKFDASHLNLTDSTGTTMLKAMTTFGLDPTLVADAARRRQELLAFIEPHIDPDGHLTRLGAPVGIVTEVAGATRLDVTVVGSQGAALAAAAELVLASEALAGNDGPRTAVRGFDFHPGDDHGMPTQAHLSVEISAGDAPRRAAVARFAEHIQEIAGRRGVDTAVETVHRTPGCVCDGQLNRQLAAAAAAEGVTAPELTTGARHDAVALAELAAVGILYIRADRDSGNEVVRQEDAGIAARVLLHFLSHFQRV